MADVNGEQGVGLKGLNLPVSIEDAIADVLVVSLKHGAKIYRGVLMDSTKGDMPYGMNFTRSAIEEFGKGTQREKIEVVDPNEDGCPTLSGRTCPTEQATELSGLGYRHTYTQDPHLSGSRLLPPQRRPISRPLRDKNIRSMRLRPRQVLCAKCKQGIHDTTVQGNTTTLADTPDASGSADIKLLTTENTKPEPRRKRAASEERSEAPKKLKKLQEASNIVKSSPVIKISFANPQGRGTVVKIPRRPNNPTPSDGESLGDISQQDVENTGFNHEEYHKLRKTLKKAKLKGKYHEYETTGPAPKIKISTGHHKKSKHNKRKVKRKHRHKSPGSADDTPQGENQEIHDENSTEFSKYGKLSCRIVNVHESPLQDLSDNDGVDLDIDSNSDQFSVIAINDDSSSQECFPIKPALSGGGGGKLLLTDESYHKVPTNVYQDYDSSRRPDTDDDVSESDSYDSTEDRENCEDLSADSPPSSEDRAPTGSLRPLMMRIQNRSVNKVMLEDGRSFTSGDVVWGKIHGFPWWPGRIITINQSLKDNGLIITQTAHVSWFASSTMSHMPCTDLYPFLEDFKLRFNKKKRGPYKLAIKQATMCAKSMVADLNDVDLDLLDE